VRPTVIGLVALALTGSALTAGAQASAPRTQSDEGSSSYAETAQCASSWKLVGSDPFQLPSGLTRSQGVTTDGHGWVFSWQGGLERTDDSYLTQAVGTWPAQIAVQPQVNADGTNHFGGNHIGDVDYYNGLIYAPIEDGGENLQVATMNDPEYQHPYIALYDAKTLLPTGVTYALDKSIHEAGVPWVAVDAKRREVYTAEWDMPHDRLNVFDTQMRFQHFLPLDYPAALGAGFHLGDGIRPDPIHHARPHLGGEQLAASGVDPLADHDKRPVPRDDDLPRAGSKDGLHQPRPPTVASGLRVGRGNRPAASATWTTPSSHLIPIRWTPATPGISRTALTSSTATRMPSSACRADGVFSSRVTSASGTCRPGTFSRMKCAPRAERGIPIEGMMKTLPIRPRSVTIAMKLAKSGTSKTSWV
jgi:hypothetical protein